jgi:type I restriction-modification system DNA methylase subunit
VDGEPQRDSSDGCDSFNGKIRVFETNAYDVPDRAQIELIPKEKSRSKDGDFLAWKQDIADATQAKKKNQYRVVVGNPPWRNPSPACRNAEIMSTLKNDVMPWAWEYEGQKLSSLKGCIHGVRDDYAFFIGLGARLLQDRGLMAYVTNESWLTAPSYTLLRKHLLDNFQIHAVVRIGPYFDGVKERASIVIAENTGKANAGRTQEIRYIDWSDLSNPDWSRDWVDDHLESIIRGGLSRNAWSKIVAAGSECRIREKSSSSY